MELIDPNETPEERKQRVDKILEKNTRKPRTCISCMNPILPNQAVIETIHGPYHGLPLTCVNGRD